MEIKITDSVINVVTMTVYRFVLALIITIVASWVYSVPIEHIMIGITVTYLTEIFIILNDYYL
jgi:polyribonucleotide nucleotidyltransferase